MSSIEVGPRPERKRGGHGLTRATDLKPENLLYLTKSPESDLVLADFGIAKMLDSKDEVLTTMAGSFGYAAPEVMLKQGHGKPVDMWSMGVITYTLLCGYSPFRSENLQDLIDECSNAQVIFHERYWKDVSQDAKDFILKLLQPRPDDRWTSTVSNGACPARSPSSDDGGRGCDRRLTIVCL
jgi:calcium/calmodulin-dependent protein kinase I